MVNGGDSSHNLSCANQPLERVTQFKYLGLQLLESGHISHRISPIVAKATASWAIVWQKHAQLQCGDTVCLKIV